MADDGPSAEDAATELSDGDSRVTRERHKRQDASSSTTTSTTFATGTGQDVAWRLHHEDATPFENNNPHNTNNNNNNNNNNNSNSNCHHHSHHHHHHCHNHHHHHREDGGGATDNNNKDVGDVSGGDRSCVHQLLAIATSTAIGAVSAVVTTNASTMVSSGASRDENSVKGRGNDEEKRSGGGGVGGADQAGNGGSRIENILASGVGGEGENDNGVDSGGSNGSGVGGGAMIVTRSSAEEIASSVDARRLTTNARARANCKSDMLASIVDIVALKNNPRTEANDRSRGAEEDASGVDRRVVLVACRKREEERRSDAPMTDGAAAVAAAATAAATTVTVAGSGVVGGVAGGVAGAVAAATAGGVSTNGLVAAAVRHQGSPFKGQVRTAEDTLVGPCGKKRCADRYDSSESSDSGVAVSCGECSSSGTSDITEPGSPCSTSSDEGVGAIRGASASPLPSLPKLAPSSQIITRRQWPWTPPLAATACSTYKRLKGEPEAGALPRSGAADPTSRGTSKVNGKANNGVHRHHETQGKITEYFKAQIKPQQSKIKKSSETMSVLVAKSTSEFRRPPTVQRNKGGLAKYLGAVSPNGRVNSTNDWEVRTLTMSPPPMKKPPPVIVPRTNGKMDKKLPKPVPSLPISNDVLKNIPSCKISSLRLTSEASPSAAKGSSPPPSPAPILAEEAVNLDYKGCILSKPHVNENNNLTNGCASILGALRSQSGQDHPLSRLSPTEHAKKETEISPADDEDIEEEEEEDSRSSESKPPLSPILSAPTTIRFPARAPEKDRPQGADSGICRWDKCEESFESSGGLLEHLQAAHINTQTGGDNFVCQWQGCKVQGRSSCSRRWLERHVLSHGGNKPFRCIVDGCGSRFSSQTALERHVNGHFNQPETSSSSGRRSCENGGKLVRRNGKRLRYRRQPWSARIFDYFDSGVMEGLQHRLLELAKSRTQGYLAETPGNSMALTSQVLARRVELDGTKKVLLRWYPQDIEPDEWVLESEVKRTKHVEIRKVVATNPEEVSLALYPAISAGTPPAIRTKQRRKPVKIS